MNNCFKLMISLALALLLSACSFGHTSVSRTKHSLHQKKLASGATVTLGMVEPTPAWGCQVLAKQNYKWSLMELEGEAKIMGGFVMVENHAIDYANKNNLKTNYIYYVVPSTSSIGIVDVTAVLNHDRVPVVFYKCLKIIDPSKS